LLDALPGGALDEHDHLQGDFKQKQQRFNAFG
jgi:hypothetical protein